MALSERDRAILDFERGWWLEAGSKETAMRERLDLSPTRYRELLNELVDSADALDYDPMVVRRLRKSRERRRQARFERRSAGEPPVR
ncbi:MAG: hypothetical protein QOF60_1124 [Actinomycetota bacterium]|jgi:hypothetical protein|nr:hypothetical protein [Actinomycetota bacterium]